MIPSFVSNPDPSIYLSDNYVVLDFEIDTSYGDYGHPVHPENQMLLACWKLGPGHPGVVCPVSGVAAATEFEQWGNELEMTRLTDAIKDADFLVAHQAKYELGWLRRCGVDLTQLLVFDTKIAEYVLFGNLVSLQGKSTSLNICAQRRGLAQKDPVVDHLLGANVNPVDIPKKWLSGRCHKDVRDTETVFLDQRERLVTSHRLGVTLARCLLTPCLADMEFAGMAFDRERVVAAWQAEKVRLAELGRELDGLTGGINWNSSDQVGEFLYGKLGFKELTNSRGEPKRTPTGKRTLKDGTVKQTGGKPKTDSATLAKLKATTAEQRKFLELYGEVNKASSALSKSLDFAYGHVTEGDGIFYAEFNQTVTATHRLSSSGMRTYFKQFDGVKTAQFQNWPRKYKNLFCARREGWLICEWDGSGMEFRSAGLISSDPQIAADITDPEFDPHRRTASILNGLQESEITKGLRQAAKPDTFKPLYGGQSGTAAQQRYYAAFRERYSVLSALQESWVYQILEKKQLTMPWGLTYFFPYARLDNSGYISDRTKVSNYPIQGLATAEIIPLAVVWFWHRVHDLGLQEVIIPMNTIHDSVLAEVHPDYLEQYKEISLEVWDYVYLFFERVYHFPLTAVPLGTEIVWGKHWSEGEEVQYNVWPDGRKEMVQK